MQQSPENREGRTWWCAYAAAATPPSVTLHFAAAAAAAGVNKREKDPLPTNVWTCLKSIIN